MIYAPIIIPTLNRFEKLKDCIDSLVECTGAEQTDVYISLDYPPTEKYYDGYNKIRLYLGQENPGFKSYNVFYQKQNLGPFENRDFLRKQISDKYDRYIYTEDDNVFSPCFLDYINKGLELFEENQNVLVLCGYRPETHEDDSPNNVCESYVYESWGYGTWFYKENRIRDQINRNRFREILKDYGICYSMYTNRPDLFRYLFEAALSEPKDINGEFKGYLYKNGTLADIDHTYSPIMYITDCYSVVPSESMVRNTGVEDLSGNHTCTWNSYEYSKQVICKNRTFDFVLERSLHPYKELDKLSKPDYRPAVRAWFLRKIYLVFGVKVTRALMYFSRTLTRIFC